MTAGSKIKDFTDKARPWVNVGLVLPPGLNSEPRYVSYGMASPDLCIGAIIGYAMGELGIGSALEVIPESISVSSGNAIYIRAELRQAECIPGIQPDAKPSSNSWIDAPPYGVVGKTSFKEQIKGTDLPIAQSLEEIKELLKSINQNLINIRRY